MVVAVVVAVAVEVTVVVTVVVVFYEVSCRRCVCTRQGEGLYGRTPCGVFSFHGGCKRKVV